MLALAATVAATPPATRPSAMTGQPRRTPAARTTADQNATKTMMIPNSTPASSQNVQIRYVTSLILMSGDASWTQRPTTSAST
jgi:hypothetical protein